MYWLIKLPCYYKESIEEENKPRDIRNPHVSCSDLSNNQRTSGVTKWDNHSFASQDSNWNEWRYFSWENSWIMLEGAFFNLLAGPHQNWLWEERFLMHKFYWSVPRAKRKGRGPELTALWFYSCSRGDAISLKQSSECVFKGGSLMKFEKCGKIHLWSWKILVKLIP